MADRSETNPRTPWASSANERPSHLEVAVADAVERQAVDQHLHETRVGVAPDDARFPFRHLGRGYGRLPYWVHT